MATAPRKASRPAAEPKTGRGLQTRKSTEVADWEKKLEADAEAAAGMEKGAPAGRNFSFKGGKMTFDGAPIPGNEIPVIIVASVIAKAFYAGRYDPDNPEPPACYAFSDDPDTIAPKADEVTDLQAPECAECPWNVFGSADTGKGKACKDSRKLALIPAGKLDKSGNFEAMTDPKLIEKAELGFAMIPPTSLTAYAGFVRQVASTMKRPPYGIYALMTVEPDDKNQFKVLFEPLELVDKKLMPIVFQRHEEAMDLVQLPYTYPEGYGEKKPAGRGKAAAKKPATRRKY